MVFVSYLDSSLIYFKEKKKSEQNVEKHRPLDTNLPVGLRGGRSPADDVDYWYKLLSIL